MSANHERFSKIPANACTFGIGEFEFGDNGEGAKTAPIRLLARSSAPIEHWWWGRVVHDMAGLHLHKSRLPVDYVHDDRDVIGYLNRFDVTDEGLVASGALVPYKDSDRASEIIHKAKAGVPYEASINFGGDGLRYQVIDENESAEVNGFTFTGPGVIIREWPLRGVAVCPYGADMNTSSAVNFSARTFSATELDRDDANAKETGDMKPEPEVTETVEAAEPEVDETVEGAPEAAEELAQEPPEEPEAEPEEPRTFAVDELERIVTDFGPEIACEVLLAGGGYEEARQADYERLKAENAELRARAVPTEPEAGEPAEFKPSDPPAETAGMSGRPKGQKFKV